MNPIFFSATSNPQGAARTEPQPSQAARTDAQTRNAQKNERTQALFAALFALDKSQNPRDERRARELVQDIALHCDCLCTAAVMALLKARRGATINTPDTEDLLQEARLGLVKAIRRFNPDKGVSFASYAYPLIMGEMRHFLRDRHALIRESSHAQARRFQGQDKEAPVGAYCAGLPGQHLPAEMGNGFSTEDGQLLDSVQEPDFAPQSDHRLTAQGALDALLRSPHRVDQLRGRAVQLRADGAKLHHIAADLGCSTSTARALLSTGIAAIKGALDE